MSSNRPERFRGPHFPEEIIVLCVRWYLRYCLSYRDLEEMMAERGVEVDHSTIARWILHFAPILNDLVRREMRPAEPLVASRRNLYSGCGPLHLFIQGHRLGREYDRFHVVAEPRSGRGERFSAIGCERHVGSSPRD